MVEVKVEYDYEAELSDELTIEIGDIIKDVNQMEGGWWEGTLRGKRGVFPDNFVKVLNGPKKQSTSSFKNKENNSKHQPPQQQESVQLRKNFEKPSAEDNKNEDTTRNVPKRCRVLFSYSPTHEDELELQLDDIIEVHGEVEDGWWRGTLNGSSGVFPSNFVAEVVTSKSSSEKPKQSQRPPLLATESTNKIQIVENKNVKNENLKEPISSKPTSKISSLIKEAEAKAKKPISSTLVESSNNFSTFVESVRNVNSSSENPIPSSSAIVNKQNHQQRQSPLGRESNVKSDKNLRTRNNSITKSATNALKQSTSSSAPKLPPKPVKEQCVVVFPYPAVNEDELDLKEGQIVNILSKEVEDKGWWKGELDGKIGVFPDNFVKMLPPTQNNSTEEISVNQIRKPARPPNSPAVGQATTGDQQGSSTNVPISTAASTTSNIKAKDFVTKKNNSFSDNLRKNSVGSSSGSSSSSSANKPSTQISASNSDIKRQNSKEQRRSSFGISGISNSKPKPPSANAKPVNKIQTKFGGKNSNSNSSEQLDSSQNGKMRQTSLTGISNSNNNSNLNVASNIFDFDIVQIQSKLDHPTAGRAKAPNRRPPSSHFSKNVKSNESSLVYDPTLDEKLTSNKNFFMSKSLEDVADVGGDIDSSSRVRKRTDGFNRSMHVPSTSSNASKDEFSRKDSKEKGRLSFKLVRQVKDVLGLSNGGRGHSDQNQSQTNSSNGESSTTNKIAEKTHKKNPPPKPPISNLNPLTKDEMNNSSSADLIVPTKTNSEAEAKKPDWLEELSRKQACRKSVLLKESENHQQVKSEETTTNFHANVNSRVSTSPVHETKPQIPTKPSQIREEARKSITAINSRPNSIDSNSVLTSNAVPVQSSSPSSPPIIEPTPSFNTKNGIEKDSSSNVNQSSFTASSHRLVASVTTNVSSKIDPGSNINNRSSLPPNSAPNASSYQPQAVQKVSSSPVHNWQTPLHGFGSATTASNGNTVGTVNNHVSTGAHPPVAAINSHVSVTAHPPVAAVNSHLVSNFNKEHEGTHLSSSIAAAAAHFDEKKATCSENEDLEKLSLLERVRRLEKLLVEVKSDYEKKLTKLNLELEIEKSERKNLEQNLEKFQKTSR